MNFVATEFCRVGLCEYGNLTLTGYFVAIFGPLLVIILLQLIALLRTFTRKAQTSTAEIKDDITEIKAGIEVIQDHMTNNALDNSEIREDILAIKQDLADLIEKIGDSEEHIRESKPFKFLSGQLTAYIQDYDGVGDLRHHYSAWFENDSHAVIAKGDGKNGETCAIRHIHFGEESPVVSWLETQTEINKVILGKKIRGCPR